MMLLCDADTGILATWGQVRRYCDAMLVTNTAYLLTRD